MSDIPYKAPKLRGTQMARLIPNAITIAALSAGLTAMRFALMGRYEIAVALIVTAAILDGLDGRIARLLRADSNFGAELDSLSDFICFGVAPSIIVYVYTLHHWAGAGWTIVLLFTLCQALRLARFNVKRRIAKRSPDWMKHFAVGVPAPAGAILGISPFFVGFAYDIAMENYPYIYAITFIIAGFMMISRIPTYLVGKLRVSPRYVRLLLFGVVLFIAGLLSAPWYTLMCGTIAYILSIPMSIYSFRKKKRVEG